MSLDPDPFNENSDSSASACDQPGPSNAFPVYLGSESADAATSDMDHMMDALHSNGEARREFRWFPRQVIQDRRELARERQQLLEENARLADENRLLKERNLSLTYQVEKLAALNPFAEDLQNAPDLEITSQHMARRLQKLFPCNLVLIFHYDSPEHCFRLSAAAGASAQYVSGAYTLDVEVPVIRQALQSRKAVFTGQYSADGPDFSLHGKPYASLLAAPILQEQDLRGMLLLADQAETVFSGYDLPVVETAANLLSNAWCYAHKTETLTEFVQAVSSLAMVQDTGSLLEVIASLARRTLNASYCIIAVLNQHEWMIRASGHAPKIFASLQNGAAIFLDEASQSPYTFRLRDLNRDERSARIEIDSPELQSLLASPIRINGAAAGVLLTFGKIGEEAFTDTDVFMTELLVTQAAVNLESCYLNQELRNSLKTTQLLYELSRDISQAEDLEKAAQAISRTACRLLEANSGGMILFSSDGRKEAEVRIPADDDTLMHPYAQIQQAMDSRQTIYISESETTTRIAIPIQTMRRCYGALWLDLPEDQEESRHPTEEIRILVNQAAVALERSILLEETRRQTTDLRRANQLLIDSYDQLLEALMRALDARDSETEGHSARVKRMALDLGKEYGLSKDELKSLEHGALLHDIGKIGIRDSVLLKPGPLDPEEWRLMRRHPQIGTRIIQEIPALHDALPVIAFHQERWDGSGYPLRLKGQEIPLLARIFAVVDVFDALTSERPYRTKMTTEEALEHLISQSGSSLDPVAVAKFVELVRRDYLASG